MKADTRNGYIKRYDAAIRQVIAAMQGDCVPPDLLEKLQGLFNAGKQLEALVYESENTLHVSNKLQAFESRVLNAMGGDFSFQPPSEEEEKIEEGSIADMIVQAQTLLLNAYERAIQGNSLAAHVPAIMGIKSRADDLKGTLADVMKVSALLS